MIRKLRRKFILTNMALVSLVLLIVFGVLLWSHSQKSAFQTDAALRSALTWRSDSPPPRLEIGTPPPNWDGDGKGRRPSMVPVFVVTLDADGAIADVNGGNSVAISDQVLDQVVAGVPDGENRGTLSALGLRYLRETGVDATVRVAFADLTWERESLQSLVATSLLVGFLGLVGFFLISLALSRLALRPVEASWEGQRRFVADASHELKTPLTVILTNIGILLSHRDETVESQAKWAEYIRDEAQRMRILVEDLLFLAKNDGLREPAFPPISVNFSELCWSTLLPFEPVAFEAGATLNSTILPALTLTGRSDQLRRLVGILLDNAVKYAGPHGAIAFTLARGEKGGALLTVCNTGSAIPPQHMAHLFDRFYRADDSRTRASGGYGLGLAIAKSIVSGHGGTIGVKSAEGETVFTVKLPLG